MRGQNQHFGYLHMSRRIGGIDGHVGNVVARQGLDAGVEFGGAFGIATEARLSATRSRPYILY